LAVQRLVQLIVSEKEETARKACLDLISLQLSEELQNFKNPQKQSKKIHPKLTPEKAARMLAMLAEPDETPNSLSNNEL